ncbi:MAG: pseudouridine-5'-phosphate glycosidase [Flavobacteriales bacterium]|jgi:pseudouridine-5'-phosphate glycosidase|tara:strand:- start:278 stop:1192 length:915 start_codon:yes stop_codon:yes gene_type:complete
MTDLILLSDEVKSALSKGTPVVALESTIISHGMPYPENVKTARKLEDIIRAEGSVPAIVAVADGKLHVGISDALLERLATEKGVLKVSRRDIPTALASGAIGATTVSATLIAAHRAGVRVFVTGGIGGVHRGAEKTFDISADLEELAVSNVAVISAGVKAILDLPKTLEVLETKGVPVVGFQTDDLPAFYTRKSGLKLVAKADSPNEIASMMKSKWDCDIEGSILVMNPIPKEFEADADIINASIDEALALADKKGVCGKEITPFLLAHIAKVTGGDSLAANIALVENNARVGAQVAKAYSLLT